MASAWDVASSSSVYRINEVGRLRRGDLLRACVPAYLRACVPACLRACVLTLDGLEPKRTGRGER